MTKRSNYIFSNLVATCASRKCIDGCLRWDSNEVLLFCCHCTSCHRVFDIRRPGLLNFMNFMETFNGGQVKHTAPVSPDINKPDSSVKTSQTSRNKHDWTHETWQHLPVLTILFPTEPLHIQWEGDQLFCMFCQSFWFPPPRNFFGNNNYLTILSILLQLEITQYCTPYIGIPDLEFGLHSSFFTKQLLVAPQPFYQRPCSAWNPGWSLRPGGWLRATYPCRSDRWLHSPWPKTWCDPFFCGAKMFQNPLGWQNGGCRRRRTSASTARWFEGMGCCFWNKHVPSPSPNFSIRNVTWVQKS